MKQARKESQLQRCVVVVVELGTASVPDPARLPMMCPGTISLGEEGGMHFYTVLYAHGQRVAPQGINGLFNSQFAHVQMPGCSHMSPTAPELAVEILVWVLSGCTCWSEPTQNQSRQQGLQKEAGEVERMWSVAQRAR